MSISREQFVAMMAQIVHHVGLDGCSVQSLVGFMEGQGAPTDIAYNIVDELCRLGLLARTGATLTVGSPEVRAALQDRAAALQGQRVAARTIGFKN